MIEVTESAARHLLDLLEEKDFSPEEKGLRLFVEKGGCAGMSYAMKIDAPAEGDAIYSCGEARVLVDAESLVYLDGCHLDYVDALNDAGFKIENPNAARSCGCGTSFEPAKAGAAPAYDPATMDGEVCGTGKG
ncbi:MAG: iron-sulfur cluster assembly accessory protein [Verrucomicrobiales bacterium]